MLWGFPTGFPKVPPKKNLNRGFKNGENFFEVDVPAQPDPPFATRGALLHFAFRAPDSPDLPPKRVYVAPNLAPGLIGARGTGVGALVPWP
jgi:hypothetical protein